MKCGRCTGAGFNNGYPCAACGATGKVAYVVQPAVAKAIIEAFEKRLGIFDDDEPTDPQIVIDTMFDAEEPRCGDCGGVDIEPFELNGAMRRHCWSCGKVSSREEHTL